MIYQICRYYIQLSQLQILKTFSYAWKGFKTTARQETQKKSLGQTDLNQTKKTAKPQAHFEDINIVTSSDNSDSDIATRKRKRKICEEKTKKRLRKIEETESEKSDIDIANNTSDNNSDSEENYANTRKRQRKTSEKKNKKTSK